MSADLHGLPGHPIRWRGARALPWILSSLVHYRPQLGCIGAPRCIGGHAREDVGCEKAGSCCSEGCAAACEEETRWQGSRARRTFLEWIGRMTSFRLGIWIRRSSVQACQLPRPCNQLDMPRCSGPTWRRLFDMTLFLVAPNRHDSLTWLVVSAQNRHDPLT